MVWDAMLKIKYGSGRDFGIKRLLETGVYEAAYPLHEVSVFWNCLSLYLGWRNHSCNKEDRRLVGCQVLHKDLFPDPNYLKFRGLGW